MGIGKLYRSDDEQFEADVSYRLQRESATDYRGELILKQYGRIGDGDGYIIELEDKRKSKCHLKKQVNRAVCEMPPRYTYHFVGADSFE